MAVTEPSSVQSAAPSLDVAVSFVLFHTAVAEVERAVAQALAARCRTHVVLVDNSVPPLALPAFDEDRVTLLRTGRNLGYGRAHNLAIALMRPQARYHLVMNTDVEMADDAIDRMVEFMDRHPEAGLSGPRIRYPDGCLQAACRVLPDPVDIFVRGFLGSTRWARRRNDRYELADWSYDQVADIPFLPGCFMMMRRSVLDQVRGFDERFFLFAEDLDLSRRIHAVAACLFNPQVEIVHELRTKTRFSWRRHWHKVVNLTRYFNKWGWIADSERRRVNAETRRRLLA